MDERILQFIVSFKFFLILLVIFSALIMIFMATHNPTTCDACPEEAGLQCECPTIIQEEEGWAYATAVIFGLVLALFVWGNIGGMFFLVNFLRKTL